MENLLAQKISLTPNPSSGFGKLSEITVPGLISGGISLILIIAALVFFFMFVIGGIRWITSGGDKAQTEGARNQITAAIVGLVVVFSAWAIMSLIKVLFGVNILGGFDIPSLFPAQSVGGGAKQGPSVPQ